MKSKRLPRQILAASWLVMTGCATTGHEPSASVPRAVIDWGRNTGRSIGSFFSNREVRDETQRNLVDWFTNLSESLHARTVESMAAWSDEAQALVSWGRRDPSLAPHASWLEARLAYFEAADEAVLMVPAVKTAPVGHADASVRTPPPRSVVASPTIPRRPAMERIPRTPPATYRKSVRIIVPPPATEKKRQDAISGNAYWRRKVARNAPPPKTAISLVPRIQDILRAEGMPECLVWVAEVESTMDPNAVSPAGAAGLFQLMPATARSLGLKTDSPDERFDPEANTRAAARYYRRLYRRFDSWPLVFAAYNCGQTRLARVMKQSGGRDFETLAHRLPLETRMYVPRVQETIRLRTGVAPENIPPPR